MRKKILLFLGIFTAQTQLSADRYVAYAEQLIERMLSNGPLFRETRTAFEENILRPGIRFIAQQKPFMVIKDGLDNGTLFKTAQDFITDQIKESYIKAAEQVYVMTASISKNMGGLREFYNTLLPTYAEQDAFIASALTGGLIASYFMLAIKDKNASLLRKLYNRLSLIAYGATIGGTVYLLNNGK